MKVENNIFALNNNFGILNNNKRTKNRTYTSNEMNYDTVSFLGKKPKDGIKTIKKAISKTTKGTGKRHIKNVMRAQLNPKTQEQIENMHRNFDFITEIFSKLKTNPPRAEKIKSEYTPIITGTKKHGLTFRMPYPDTGNTITISKSKNQPNLMRLIITNPEGKETHTLLDGFDKVVGNLNKKAPQFMPVKFRYMTVAELEQSEVKKHIHIANGELKNFAQYLEEVTEKNPIKTRKNNAVATGSKVITEGPQKLTREQSIDKLLEIFNKGAEDLPSHINPQISSSSKKVVIFSLKTEDGGTLRVSKRINPEYGSDLRYLTLEKISSEGYKHYISIDLDTKEFLKCDQINGKPRIVNEFLLNYTPEERKSYGIEDKFNQYFAEIFKPSKEINTPREVTILKTKEKTQPKQKFEDIDVSEFEDKRISEQIAKEQSQKLLSESTPKATETKVEQPVEEIKVVKKRGRKPKVKTEQSEQPKVSESTNPIEKFKTDILSQATNDANKFADEYFNTFVTQFKKVMDEKMSEFQSKLNDLIK